MGGGRPVELEDGRVWCEWIVDFPCPSAEVAACYPYATKAVTRLVSETGGYWRSDTIGVSQQGRPLTRLSNHTGAEEQSERKPGLYLVARQHSGETPGSWVLDGLLRELARTDESRYLVWTVPLTNIDGVVQGDYGKDNYPYDLNRAWGHPPMRHETLVFQRDFRLFRRRCVPVALIDFHAPGLADSDGAFAFGLDYEDPLRRNRQHRLLQVLGDALGSLACDEFDRRAAYASRWNTPWAAEFAKSRGCIGFSIETPYQAAGDRVFTQELYREAGALIARGLSNLVPNLLDPT
jgi:predicted deacylase